MVENGYRKSHKEDPIVMRDMNNEYHTINIVSEGK